MLICRFFLCSILSIMTLEKETFFILWACYNFDWFGRGFILWYLDWMDAREPDLIVPFYLEIFIECFYDFPFIVQCWKGSSSDSLRVGKYSSRLILVITRDLVQDVVVLIIGFFLTYQYKRLAIVLFKKRLNLLEVEVILKFNTLILQVLLEVHYRRGFEVGAENVNYFISVAILLVFLLMVVSPFNLGVRFHLSVDIV